jgi:hypothetical protein
MVSTQDDGRFKQKALLVREKGILVHFLQSGKQNAFLVHE